MHGALLVTVSCFLLNTTLTFYKVLPTSNFMLFTTLAITRNVIIPFFSKPFASLLRARFGPTCLKHIFSLFSDIDLLPSVVKLFVAKFVTSDLKVTGVFVYYKVTVMFASVLVVYVPTIESLRGRDG